MDSYYTSGQILNQDLLDENSSWRDTIETLLNELGEAGVSGEHTQKLACFLYSAYQNRQHLLLAGPHGIFIANALSTSLFGKTAGVLDCCESFSCDTLRKAENSEDQVIAIKNIFYSSCLTPIIDLLQNTKKQYFILHPFIEDLIIEPQSLYNYMFPVVTEVLVDHLAEKNFVGGKMVQNYKEHTPAQTAPDSFLRKLYMGQFASLRMQRVLADAQDMLDSESKDMAFLLAYFPYAYVTGRTSLLEGIQAISKGVRDCVMRFIDGQMER